MITTTRFLRHCITPGPGDTAVNDWIKVPSLLPPTISMPKEGDRQTELEVKIRSQLVASRGKKMKPADTRDCCCQGLGRGSSEQMKSK